MSQGPLVAPGGGGGPGVTPSQTFGGAAASIAMPEVSVQLNAQTPTIATSEIGFPNLLALIPNALRCSVGNRRTSTCVRRMPATHRTIRRTPPTRGPTRVRSDQRYQ